MAHERHPVQLRQKMEQCFNTEELRTLCFDLTLDYDDLPARGKAGKVRELVDLADRSNLLLELISWCQKNRPNEVWTYQSRLFISYRHETFPDEDLANDLHNRLEASGHDVFIDQLLLTGAEWLKEIDRQISLSDFLVVLLSKSSVDSEMVQAELQRAYEYKNEQGYPIIIPVRINYEGMLPFTIANFTNPLQYISWNDDVNDDFLVNSISKAINGLLPDQEPIKAKLQGEQIIISEDGRDQARGEELLAPLPAFDPRLLEGLDAPGGAVQLRDKFYVERKSDGQLRHQLSRKRTITAIRGARQIGKSSLLVRGIHYCRQQKKEIVDLDLQRLDKDDLVRPGFFFQYLAHCIARKLRYPLDEVDQAWLGPLGDQDKLTYFMEDYVLSRVGDSLILTIDEADRLLFTDYCSSFFGMIRSWFDSGAYNELWRKLIVILVISTEPYLLIDTDHQSPFNVATSLHLDDFSKDQVQRLNAEHNSPVGVEYSENFMKLFNGHPFLTRKALYTLVTNRMPWSEFERIAPTNRGPFGDHLRHQLSLIYDRPELKKAVKEIMLTNRCPDRMVRFRLERAGLIKISNGDCSCRCDLYKRYFQQELI